MKQLALFLFFVFVAASATAETVLDNEFVAATTISYYLDYPGDYMAQTFTIGHTGKLTAVGIQFSPYAHSSSLPSDDLLMRIIRTDPSGLPDITQVLGSMTIDRSLPFSTANTFVDIDVSALHVPVQAGEKLGMALSSNRTDNSGSGRQYEWNIPLFDPHPGGEFYVYSPQIFGPTPFKDFYLLDDAPKSYDAGFQIYVQPVPEPSSILLLVFGVSGVTIVGRRTAQSTQQTF